MFCLIDHIVITAPSLESGAGFVSEVLGVSLQEGGEHPRMGTHNMLLKLGDELYLEVIAPNPEARLPVRPRWFALDGLSAESSPSLAAWVARTSDINASLVSASEYLGEVEAMWRGSLDWLISIPSDGSIPLGGTAPALIQWKTEQHPAAKLEDSGLSLVKLQLFHPEPERLLRLIRSIGVDGPLSVELLPSGATPYLAAHIKTPGGIRTISVHQGVSLFES